MLSEPSSINHRTLSRQLRKTLLANRRRGDAPDRNSVMTEGPELAEYFVRLQEYCAEIEGLPKSVEVYRPTVTVDRGPDLIGDGSDVDKILRDGLKAHQNDIIRHIREREAPDAELTRGGMIADTPGFGKTRPVVIHAVTEMIEWFRGIEGTPTKAKDFPRTLFVLEGSAHISWRTEMLFCANELNLPLRVCFVTSETTADAFRNTHFSIITPALLGIMWERAGTLPELAKLPEFARKNLPEKADLARWRAKVLRRRAEAEAEAKPRPVTIEEAVMRLPLRRMVIDESHIMRSGPKTQRFRGALALRAYCRWGLSGTPLCKSTDDLKWQLHLMGVKLRDMHNKNVYNLFRKLAVRHTLAEVSGSDPSMQLTDMVEVTQTAPFATEEEARLYAALMDTTTSSATVALENTHGIGDRNYVFNTHIMFLRLMLVAPALMVANDMAKPEFADDASAVKKRGRIGTKGGSTTARTKLNEIILRLGMTPEMLREAPWAGVRSTKMRMLRALLEKQLAEGRNVLIFCEWTMALEMARRMIAEEMGITNVGYYVGGTAEAKRAAEIARVLGDPKCRIMLVSLRAGATSMTLTKFSVVAFLAPGFNPQDEFQAIKRTHRIGQKVDVLSAHLVVGGTYEEHVRQVAQRRAAVAAAIIDGQGNMDFAAAKIEVSAKSFLEFAAKQPPHPGVQPANCDTAGASGSTSPLAAFSQQIRQVTQSVTSATAKKARNEKPRLAAFFESDELPTEQLADVVPDGALYAMFETRLQVLTAGLPDTPLVVAPRPGTLSVSVKLKPDDSYVYVFLDMPTMLGKLRKEHSDSAASFAMGLRFGGARLAQALADKPRCAGLFFKNPPQLFITKPRTLLERQN